MIRLKKFKAGRLYRIALSATSVLMALVMLLFFEYVHIVLSVLLVCLPFVGYLLDKHFNTLVKNLQEIETKIQGSFNKFEVREKQYKSNVGELQKELTKLQQLNVNLQEAKTLRQILFHIAEAAYYILEFDRTLIFLYDKDSNMLKCQEAKVNDVLDLKKISVPVGPKGGVLADSFQNHEVYYLEDFESASERYTPDAPYNNIFPFETKTAVIVPMAVNDQGLGVLTIDNQSAQLPVTGQQIELLKLFAYQASLSIAHVKMQEELHQLNSELERNYQNLLQRREFYSLIAQDLSSAMTEMSFSIAEVTKSVHILTEQSENLSNRGNELLDHLSNIDDIIASMNNVTRQTKLLAFNATIEAVRVGEAGKGFAIVAEEVRKLAQHSADDSTTIKGTLTEMQGAIKAIAEVSDATHNIAILQQQGTEQMNIVTNDVMKRAEDLVESLQY